MAFAFVQAGHNGTDGTSATSIAATLSAVGAGNMVCGMVSFGSATTGLLTSVTDNAGNSYTIVRRVADAGGGATAATFYGYNLAGGPTTITANFSGTVAYRSITVQEFSGSRIATAPLDGANEQGRLQSSPGTGANAASAGASSLTPSANDCLVFGASVDTGALGSGASLYTAGTGFTEPTNAEHAVSSQVSISSEYQIQTTATAVNATFTLGSGTNHITMMMIFAVPGAPPPAVSPPVPKSIAARLAPLLRY